MLHSEDLRVIGFGDADRASDKDESKSSSHAFLLGVEPISWCSKKQPYIDVIHDGSEYTTCSLVVQKAIWLKTIRCSKVENARMSQIC